MGKYVCNKCPKGVPWCPTSKFRKKFTKSHAKSISAYIPLTFYIGVVCDSKKFSVHMGGVKLTTIKHLKNL